jgi:hypothetical protein
MLRKMLSGKRLIRFCFAVVAILVMALAASQGPMRAQTTSASVTGTVMDSTGARVVDQTVTLTGSGTGFVRTTRTNPDGFFAFTNLQSGTYVLSMAVAGFKRYEQPAIELTAGAERALPTIQLEVGQLAETVTVNAAVNPVETSSGQRAAVLAGEELRGLALRGRDVSDMLTLLPGIVDGTNVHDEPAAAGFTNVGIGGGSERSKNVTLDGVTILDVGANGSVSTMPSLGAVAEVKVLVAGYSAEYGRGGGGSVMMTTVGGTQQFHGSVGWFHRHEDLSANDFFTNRNGGQKPRYRHNLFTGNVGGPLYIPGKFNRNKERLFFFVSEEYQAQLVARGLNTVRVPTDLERSGDFSRTFDVSGKLIPIYDPMNGNAVFPGNKVPAARIDAIGKSILNIFPAPNFVDSDPTRVNQWNYQSSASGGSPRRTDTVRIDYSPRQNLQFFGRFINSFDRQIGPYGISNTTGNFPMTDFQYQRPGYGATVNGTVTISPTLVNEAMVGMNTNKIQTWPLNPDAVSRKALGINVPQWYPANNPAGFIPDMSFGGVSNAANPTLNDRMPYFNGSTIMTATDSLSKVYGTHVFKAGLFVEFDRKNEQLSGNWRGVIDFGVNANNPLNTNFAYANALLGYYNSYQEASSQPYGQHRFENIEFYVQDSWKVTHRFSLEYGIRLYHQPPLHSVDGKQYNTFVPSLYDLKQAPVLLRPALDGAGKKVALDPITGKTYAAALVGVFAPNSGNIANGVAFENQNGAPPGMYTVRAIAPAPRLGFAWDVFGNHKTAVRGGFGIYFDRTYASATYSGMYGPPTKITTTTYYGQLSGLAAAAAAGFVGPGGATSLYGSRAMPVVYNSNLDVQQEIFRGIVLDVSWVAAMGRHRNGSYPLNVEPFGARFLDLNPQNKDPTTTSALPDAFLRPWQSYGAIGFTTFDQTSNYHGMLATLNKRMGHGVSFSASYTFAKLLCGTGYDAFLPERQRNYGPPNGSGLGYDRNQSFSANYNWKLPSPGVRAKTAMLKVFDNWELAGTTKMTTGARFTPGYSLVVSQDITGTANASARVNVIDPNAAPENRFGPPARGTVGNAGLGVLTGPGLNNWNLSLFRTVKLTEKGPTLQLRFESYNTFNHAQFTGVNQTARFDATGKQIDPTFLQPTSGLDGRRLQLGVMMRW